MNTHPRRNPWTDGPAALPARRPRKPGRTARYYAVLPAEPTTLTQDKAAEHWRAVTFLLDASLTTLAGLGVYGAWDKHERANLKRIQHRWERRATGADQRWLRVGSSPGGYQGTGLSRDLAELVAPAPDPAWTDE